MIPIKQWQSISTFINIIHPIMFHTNVYKGVHHLSGLGNGKWTVVDGQTIFFVNWLSFIICLCESYSFLSKHLEQSFDMVLQLCSSNSLVHLVTIPTIFAQVDSGFLFLSVLILRRLWFGVFAAGLGWDMRWLLSDDVRPFHLTLVPLRFGPRSKGSDYPSEAAWLGCCPCTSSHPICRAQQ